MKMVITLTCLPSTNHQLYEPALALIGKTLHSELPQENADKLLATVRDGIRLQQTQTIEYERDGVIGRRLVEGRAQPLGYTVNDKQVVVFLSRDITDRKIKEDEIAYLAFYDPLTGLPNRKHCKIVCIKHGQPLNAAGSVVHCCLSIWIISKP